MVVFLWLWRLSSWGPSVEGAGDGARQKGRDVNSWDPLGALSPSPDGDGFETEVRKIFNELPKQRGT